MKPVCKYCGLEGHEKHGDDGRPVPIQEQESSTLYGIKKSSPEERLRGLRVTSDFLKNATPSEIAKVLGLEEESYCVPPAPETEPSVEEADDDFITNGFSIPARTTIDSSILMVACNHIRDMITYTRCN